MPKSPLKRNTHPFGELLNLRLLPFILQLVLQALNIVESVNTKGMALVQSMSVQGGSSCWGC